MTQFFLLMLLCTLFLRSAVANDVRDPFWPIGYQPPKPEVLVPKPAEPVVPKPQVVPPPVIKPISDSDWTLARKTLTISGFTQSVIPNTGEKRVFAMINRQTYAPGDTLCVTNKGIEFLWQITSLKNQELDLKEIKAQRLDAPSLPINQKVKGLLQ